MRLNPNDIVRLVVRRPHDLKLKIRKKEIYLLCIIIARVLYFITGFRRRVSAKKKTLVITQGRRLVKIHKIIHGTGLF